ncbi:MAG TPA: hypothetical protein VED16_00300 [Candidatus Acidoferrum sp.]|nr:hypothetical protein [Candidatus Acidoferrum sp.]
MFIEEEGACGGMADFPYPYIKEIQQRLGIVQMCATSPERRNIYASGGQKGEH